MTQPTVSKHSKSWEGWAKCSGVNFTYDQSSSYTFDGRFSAVWKTEVCVSKNNEKRAKQSVQCKIL